MKKAKGIIENETIIIKVEQDEFASSPREWDNLGKMICWHSRYNLGDDHSYSEPRDLLEDLAKEAIHSERGQQLIQEKADKEFAGYQIVTNEAGEFLLVPQNVFDEIHTEEVASFETGKEKIYEIFAQLVSEEYTESPRTAQYLAQARAGVDVQGKIRVMFEHRYAFSVFKIESRFFVYDARKTRGEFDDEVFETKEAAAERLEEAKEAWMEDEPEALFTFEELHEFINADYILLPLYLYDHSGITMNTTGFSCSWDSGQVGFIYASKARFKEETGYLESELFNTDQHRVPVVGEGVKVRNFKADTYDDFGKVVHIEGDQVTVDFDYYKTPEAKKEENMITVSLEEIMEVRSEYAKEMLKSEVAIYDQYLRGDVYAFVVEKVTSCDCCGSEETEEIDACSGFYGDDPFENGMSDHIETKYHGLLKELA